MIVPSGKRRDQVSQGLLQNAYMENFDIFSKFAQNIDRDKLKNNDIDQPGNSPKDLKMDELQQSLNESNTLPGPQKKNQSPEMPQQPNMPGMDGDVDTNSDSGVTDGMAFIDISKRISEKVIQALGLNKQPNEHWQGKTEIANDGDEVTGITIKLTRAMPKDMAMQGKVEKSGPGYGEPITQQQPMGGQVTRSAL